MSARQPPPQNESAVDDDAITTPGAATDPATVADPAPAPDADRRWLQRVRSGATAPTVGWPGRLRLPTRESFQDIQLPHAFQNVNFRRYWTSQLVSLAGTWMQNTGSTLVVLSLTSSAFAIGAINVVTALPLLLFSLFGGVVADRSDRRLILVRTQTMLGVIALLYAWLIWSDRIEYWHILVIAALAGTVMAFELPASQAFVSELVDREDLPQALALNSTSFNLTRTIGPAFAGIVISLLGTAAAFVINAGTLLAPISVLLGLKGKVREQPRAARGSGLAQLKEGVHHIRTHDDLLGLVMLSSVFSFLVFPNLLVLMPLYVDHVLGGGEGWVALMISMLGIGSLIGSITILRGSRLEVAAGRRLRIAMAGLTVGTLWLGLSQNPWMAVPGVMIAGFSFTIGNIQINTRLQQLAPETMRGRVLSVNGLAFNGVMPFATIGISLLTELIGQHLVMVICAVLLAGMSFLLWRTHVWKAFVPPPPIVAPVPSPVTP